MRRTLVAAAILCAALYAQSSAAETKTYHSEFSITALGLPVGVTRFETSISPDGYTVTGSLAARGLVALFQPTSGTLRVNGQFGTTSARPQDFALNYVSGNDKQSIEIGFENNTVNRIVYKPKARKHRDWIEVSPDQLRGTLDPISALLVPADSMRGVCDRMVQIFDGAMRLDVKLSYLRTIPFSTDGYSGDAVTCRATFDPVSGYHSKRKEIIWLRDKGRVDISFAPIAGSRLYAPVKATIATQIGPVRIYATRFGDRDR